jgi:hypothetical protein
LIRIAPQSKHAFGLVGPGADEAIVSGYTTTNLFVSAHSLMPASVTQRFPISNASCRQPWRASMNPHLFPCAQAFGTKTLPVSGSSKDLETRRTPFDRMKTAYPTACRRCAVSIDRGTSSATFLLNRRLRHLPNSAPCRGSRACRMQVRHPAIPSRARRETHCRNEP